MQSDTDFRHADFLTWPGRYGHKHCGDSTERVFLNPSTQKKECLIDEMFPCSTYPLQASPISEALNCLIRAQITLKIPRCTINKSALAFLQSALPLMATR